MITVSDTAVSVFLNDIPVARSLNVMTISTKPKSLKLLFYGANIIFPPPPIRTYFVGADEVAYFKIILPYSNNVHVMCDSLAYPCIVTAGMDFRPH